MKISTLIKNPTTPAKILQHCAGLVLLASLCCLPCRGEDWRKGQEHHQLAVHYLRDRQEYDAALREMEMALAYAPRDERFLETWKRIIDIKVTLEQRQLRQTAADLEELFTQAVGAYISGNYSNAVKLSDRYLSIHGDENNLSYIKKQAQLQALMHWTLGQIDKKDPDYSTFTEARDAVLSARSQKRGIIAFKYCVTILTLRPYNQFALSNMQAVANSYRDNRTLRDTLAGMILEHTRSGYSGTDREVIPGVMLSDAYIHGFYLALNTIFPEYRKDLVSEGLRRTHFGYELPADPGDVVIGTELIDEGTRLCESEKLGEGVAKLQEGLAAYPQHLYARYKLNHYSIQLRYIKGFDKEKLTRELTEQSRQAIAAYRQRYGL